MDNTREKLIEVKNALSMCYKQGLTSECDGCGYRGHKSVCMDALMEDALAVINCLEEKQATSNESKWIPVTERLPEYETPVMGWDAELRDMGIVNFVYGQFFDIVDMSEVKVTHWMPLPEPPKEVSE